MAAEAELQRSILELLEAKRFVHWRQPLGGIRMGSGKHRKNPMSGFPDIAGVFPSGRMFAIEVKAPGEKPKPHQQEWLDKLGKSGVLVVVAKSIDDVLIALAKAEQ